MNFEVSESQSFCISTPKGLKEKSFFPQGTYNFQNLRNEKLAIADHSNVKILKLAVFNIKLLLKEDNILHILSESKLNEYNKRFECKSSFLCNH